MNVRKIAFETGFSIASVSRALRDDPKINAVMKLKICSAARSLGYERNPYYGKMMSSLRRKKVKGFRGNLTLLFKTRRPGLLLDSRVAEVVEGAERQAEKSGFSLDQIDLGESNPSAVQRILRYRGVQGLLVFMPSFGGEKVHLDIDLNSFACVSLGWGLWTPALDSVQVDYHQGMRLILQQAEPRFGAGIAAIWDFATDDAAHRVAQGAFLTHHPCGSAAASELFLSAEDVDRESLTRLVKRRRISCLVLGSSFRPPKWLEDIVPMENWIWCRSPERPTWFGRLDPQNRLVGKWGIDILATKIQLYQLGVPSQPQRILVPQQWLPGTAFPEAVDTSRDKHEVFQP